MEKRLRSSLKTSSEEFLLSAIKLGFKSSKSSLKTIIHSLKPSSDLASSLPLTLHQSISQSILRFKQSSESTTADVTKSPTTPPSKRLRRSARRSKNNDGDSGEKNQKGNCENAKDNAVEDLQVYAFVALMCISHPKKAFTPSDLLPAVRELHDNMIAFESDSVLLSEIASLSQEWWKEQLPGRETLISQSLPFLLSRSLTLKKKVDVQRVYSLREAFTLFDFEDESIEDVKLLLIRCLIAPLYLKTEDGRKFLAFMFGLSLQLVKEALAMIRSQIPFGRKSMLEAYGEIIFRAWKAVDGELKDEIENAFLQGLIDSAIHASSGSFAASIRRILGGFINQRTVEGVEKLLFRLGEPVIFRSLQVANSNVRQNALHLLLDIFPLEDPNATKESKDTLLDKQFFLLEKLLVDVCPEVRVIAVEGCCRILHLFWEIIPSSTITKVLTKIFDDMAHDVSNEVRLSTVNGIVYLLGNPHSHEILKVLLPRLGHLISDSALSVRAAVGDLLLLLSDIRNFQYHKVIPLDLLLSTLANDQELVARKITKLLLPSYFPSKVTVEEACNRCVTLVKRSPLAGARFCEFASSEGAYRHALMELFKAFISLILSPNELNAEQIDALLIGSAHLCKDLVSEAFCLATLKEDLSGEKLKSLFCAAASGPAQSSVRNIISMVSPGSVDDLLELCMGVVTNCGDLSENIERQSEVRSVHKMMMSCDCFDNMFEALTRLLEKSVSKCSEKVYTESANCDKSTTRKEKSSGIYSSRSGKKSYLSDTRSGKKSYLSDTRSGKKSYLSDTRSGKKSCVSDKRRRGKRSVSDTSRFKEDYEISVGIAWQIKDLLIADDMREAMLQCKILEDAFSALKVISEVSIVHCMQWDCMNTASVLAYAYLAFHLSVKSINGNNNSGYKKKASVRRGSLFSEDTLLDKTMDHLLNSANELFEAYEKYDDGGSNFTKQKRISNAIKLLTAVLKFIVDAATIDLVSHYQERWLKFTLKYVDFLVSVLRLHSDGEAQFKEEELKETIICLKSSFTYTGKLLNLCLASSYEDSPPPEESSILANKLIDLTFSTEEYLGYGYAMRLIGSVKPWLPDIILALRSSYILRQTPGERMSEVSSSQSTPSLPSWLTILARIEVCELTEAGSDNEDEERESKLAGRYSAFKKLMGMMVQLLRANLEVLDSIGIMFLDGLLVGLERKDFELVLGLVHFVCKKLVSHDDGEWGDLNLMLEYVKEIYPEMEREVEDTGSCEDGKEKLQGAISLIQPVWMCYMSETGREPMDEEE